MRYNMIQLKNCKNNFQQYKICSAVITFKTLVIIYSCLKDIPGNNDIDIQHVIIFALYIICFIHLNYFIQTKEVNGLNE